MQLVGVEAWTLELRGRLPLEAARRQVAGLSLLERDGEAELDLLVFGMTGLHVRGVPWPRFSYREALWRIGVRLHGEPAWFGHTCDLDRPLVSALGRVMVRYPVRRAAIEREGGGEEGGEGSEPAWRISIEAGAGLRITARPTAQAPPPVPPRPIVVGAQRRCFRIPWREDPAPYRRRAEIDVAHDALSEATLGAPVRWDSHGLLHRGRVHRCGIARPLRGDGSLGE
ncbi:MAG: DUF2071 domain-containing protein [Myxococcales bacterium]|nr:DUF2071 domain-containing protein [Myxococcales bacterium]